VNGELGSRLNSGTIQQMAASQGHRSVFWSEGSGDEWQAPTGRDSEGQGESLKMFTSTPLDCKQIPFEYQSTSNPPAPARQSIAAF